MSQLFVSAVKCYGRMEDFWLTYSDPTRADGDASPKKHWLWTKVIKALRFQKKQINNFDIRSVRIAIYERDTKWETEFSYHLKGSKMVPLKKDAEIARRF